MERSKRKTKGKRMKNAATRNAEREKPILSIRLIVTSVAVGITAVAVLAVGAVQERHTRKALTAEITLRLLLEARNLALTSSPALLTDLPELTLHPLTKKMQSEQPELALAVVADHRGIIQGHADARMLGTPMALPEDLREERTALALGPGESLRGNGTTLVATAPVTYPGGQEIGTASVGIRRKYVENAIRAAHRQQSVVLVVVLAFGVSAALGLMTSLLKPVSVLRAGLERIGRGDLDTPIGLRDRTEFGMLADTVDDMASKLKLAQAELVGKERLTHELELARQIQQSLLPKSRTVAGQFLIDGVHEAASEVGGDYYDVLPLANGNLGLAIADVSGKGLVGCLTMSMLSALLRAYRDEILSPAELLARLDERLSESLQRGSFVTMFYGILNPRTGELTFASAGHLPPFVYRAVTREVQSFPTQGIPLAAIRGGVIRRTLKDATLNLGPGDMLLQYTDGVSEAFDVTGGKQFDFSGIAATLTQGAAQGAAAVLDDLRRALEAWRGGINRHDDETILVVSREICVPAVQGVPDERKEKDAEVSDPLRLLQTARARGQRLVLHADLAGLDCVPEWVAGRRELQSISSRERELIATALYEACANIAEHGYGQDVSREFDLWWVKGRDDRNPDSPTGNADASREVGSIDPLQCGYFLIHDYGKAFSPENRLPADFRDPKVRRRRRGFGLDIIHRVMSRVVYQPGAPEGNLTLLVFDATGFEMEERNIVHG